ncbi:hypothetical protein [Mycolicibacter algericus]|uniref:Uncharacterized protein n=1 Tax=Mycolicibacter algericus DSM 45454 TaxID=723879 RepID=A0ABX3REM3_MYCAL|nr:hypothetical protein [Mycolicibacter algericus]OQZ91817.1 hypothetical protein BST10_21760 [Mycolicibacter algericus DSM 45454]
MPAGATIAAVSSAAVGGLRAIGTEAALAAVIALCPGDLARGRFSRGRDIEIGAMTSHPFVSIDVAPGFIEHALGGIDYRTVCGYRCGAGVPIRLKYHAANFSDLHFGRFIALLNFVNFVIA